MSKSAVLLQIFALASYTIAHETDKKRDGESWQSWHMREEHGMEDFDTLSFFTLHDLDGSNTWGASDILNLYGLLNKDEVVGSGDGMGAHENSVQITQKTKDMVSSTILELIDYNKDGIITADEWTQFSKAGNLLPDFGLGPGHHGDYEYEYEVHHWLKYHAENDPDVKIVHKEDIEHEQLYHAHEGEDHHDEPNQQPVKQVKIVRPIAFGKINLANIPEKYKSPSA